MIEREIYSQATDGLLTPISFAEARRRYGAYWVNVGERLSLAAIGVLRAWGEVTIETNCPNQEERLIVKYKDM